MKQKEAEERKKQDNYYKKYIQEADQRKTSFTPSYYNSYSFFPATTVSKKIPNNIYESEDSVEKSLSM